MKEGHEAVRMLRYSRRHVLMTMAALLVAGGGGFELAAAGSASSISPTTELVVESATLHAINIDDNANRPPVTTSKGPHLPDYYGAAQHSVTASSIPFQLCPGGSGVTLSAKAANEMVRFNEAEIKDYFTGFQAQAEMHTMEDWLIGGHGTLTQAKIMKWWSCSRQNSTLKSNWAITGPDVTLLMQWNSVDISGSTATVVAVLNGNDQQCNVAPVAKPGGIHAVTICGSPPPGDPIIYTVYLQRSSDGRWQVNDLSWRFAPGAGP